MNENIMDQLVGLADIAAARGVSRPAVLQAVRLGKLRAQKIAGRWLVLREDAIEYINTPVRTRLKGAKS